MPHLTKNRPPNRATIIKRRAVSAVQKFLHIQALGGIVLLCMAAAALMLANSSYAQFYHNLWHTPLGFKFGSINVSWDLHFWINDILMTIFFLTAGMEIRREIHEGALANLRQATLPIIAAIGGVVIPALIYLFFNLDPHRSHGWAVPTATDIAFAVGILSLLGKAVPLNLHVILLSLAIIDDIIAVLIIAFVYSSDLAPSGLLLVGLGIALVLFFQWINLTSAWYYVLPGGLIWWGLFITGAHPSLAGVILGMMTPVLPARSQMAPLEAITHAANALNTPKNSQSLHDIAYSLKQLSHQQHYVMAPVTRVQMTLHPWVAYIVMPLFAFANAGIGLSGIDAFSGNNAMIILGVTLGLFLGKPLGIFGAAYLAVKSGLCRLPAHVNWSGILLIGLLAGMGFTMSIFVSMLAFNDINQLNTAKIGVLFGSGLSALFGLGFGLFYLSQLKKPSAPHKSTIS